MIEVRQLKNNHEIDRACALLYDVYIDHMKWNFSANNPSQIKIMARNKKKILIDKFTYNSTWFGAFDGGDLIGCLRLSGIDESNSLDIEYNLNSKSIWRYLPAPKKLCKDITKLAIHLAYPNKDLAIKLLFVNVFKYCSSHEYSTIAFTHDTYLKSLFTLVSFPLIVEDAFKYEDIDKLPVNFYRAFTNNEISKIIDKLGRLIDIAAKPKLPDVLEILEIVAPNLPALIYWHDINGKVLGLNKICLDEMGAKNFTDIIGKTPYDFYPKKTAEYILCHNKRVIETGQILSQEESIHDITTGKFKVFKSIKAPLYDNNGNIIGIIGTSINITAEKEAEQLKLQNAKHEEKIASQEVFKNCVNNVMNMLHHVQIELSNINSNNGVSIVAGDQGIILTKREEQVLYLLSINKTPKEIAQLLSIKEDKNIASQSIGAMINKQLYPKFGVFNVSQLVEKARLLNKIPFIPDIFLNQSQDKKTLKHEKTNNPNLI